MNILITGDFVITDNHKDAVWIDDSVTNLFKKSDFRIVNLEAPITNSTSKIIKSGPHLKANRDITKETLINLNIDLVTLANNHVLDYDGIGVFDTIEL